MNPDLLFQALNSYYQGYPTYQLPSPYGQGYRLLQPQQSFNYSQPNYFENLYGTFQRPHELSELGQSIFPKNRFLGKGMAGRLANSGVMDFISDNTLGGNLYRGLMGLIR